MWRTGICRGVRDDRSNQAEEQATYDSPREVSAGPAHIGRARTLERRAGNNVGRSRERRLRAIVNAPGCVYGGDAGRPVPGATDAGGSDATTAGWTVAIGG